MTKRLRRRFRRQLYLKSWSVRLLCFALFVWTTVSTPLHLLTERHFEDSPQELAAAKSPASTVEAADHNHHGSHQPHFASDHKLRAHCQAQPAFAPCQFLPSDTFNSATPEPPFVCFFLTERVNPPARNLPAPFRARPPPLS